MIFAGYGFLLFLLLLPVSLNNAKNNHKNVLETVTDIKDFKKILRTKTNVLVCFTSSPKTHSRIVGVFKDVAELIKGQGTMLLIDCTGDGKKLCKKLKIAPETYLVKHYKDGEYHKDYDRRETLSSMLHFMRDPTGDPPWEEDPQTTHVLHLQDGQALARLLEREAKPLLVMFYAPWCGFCKSLKPEFASAAQDLRDEAAFAAIDLNRPENAPLRTQYNITGFPTLLYFRNGRQRYQYEGENKRAALVEWMRSPGAQPTRPQEPEWSEVDSEVVHLTAASFDPVITAEASALVMFYAPWCGHCKRMKPEYEAAASQIKQEGVPGMLAAVDATREQTLATRFSIRGYPHLRYFSYGEARWEVNFREASRIVEFMRNPQKPPPPPPLAHEEEGGASLEEAVLAITEEDMRPVLRKRKHALVMFYAPWCGHCKKAKPEFEKAAAHFGNDSKVLFGAVDCTVQRTLCQTYNVEGYPTLIYFSYYKVQRPYTGGRKSVDFIEFIKDPEKAIKTSSNPQEDKFFSSETVMRLDDGNFKREISKGMVLVMFYAPWCVHCKKLKPDFERAAQELRQEGVECDLAAVDCTRSVETADEQEIAGFPTLKLFYRGRHLSDYRGRLTSPEIKAFVREQVRKNKSKDEL